MTSPPISNGVTGKGGRILVVGATGFIGRNIAEASLDANRRTYILIRSFPDCHSKIKLIKAFEDKGAIILHGDINDQDYMEEMLRKYEIDIVISAVGGDSILDQLALIQAMKSVGTIKRFLPSEFGHEVDRSDPVEPGLNMYKEKRKVRRLIEELNIPYTYICCNSVASWPYYDNKHPSEVLPPLDHFQIYGDGTVKAYFVAGPDIGKFTIKAAEDYRTVDKCVHFRPQCNYFNMNELASLWETKIGRTLPKVTITEDALLAVAAENINPKSIVAALTHEIFIRGCQIEFLIDGIKDLEVCNLYPNESFCTIDECFDDFFLRMDEMCIKMPIN
ncbi:PREDICTED: leucoanthocyanidin reductase-like [Nicotiana attenuata]|uniref:Isoflavone reductase -like a622 n=1 Tax=Nicotiana attenuata TaxID=49451 RepID=A0A1J6I5H4_NICAT|nr:PREDICTED: leucoanthocyanidin reductase-like [Nicotiana attenuata]OIS95807.1 isoflavone reductase -like a622 [Nicotiana attenuata]